ncbi:sporulation protein YunB [Bacillaceae bacterium Marseille-Q3522]|nr:sporulation protein YunB [Bacillaceae bacterium Marseille-Q3522]
MLKYRRRLFRRGPLPFRYVCLLTFVFFLFTTIISLWIINAGLKPTLERYAESQTRKIATLVINKAINDSFQEVIDTTSKEVEDSSQSNVNFNTNIINRLRAELTLLIQQNIKEAEEGNLDELQVLTNVEFAKEAGEGILYYIPLGQMTNNALLGNLGPKIPIKFNAVGSIQSDVRPKLTEYGINNAYIEVNIHLKINVQIIIPFATKLTTIEENVPVVMEIIQGEVPQFYNGNGKGINPSIDLPEKP